MVIGVISDTHGLLRPQAVAALQRSDYIIHAGDAGAPEILQKLAQIAPLTAVRGNVDTGPWAARLPHEAVLQAGSLSIYVLHNRDELQLQPETAGFAAVVCGHSHQAGQEIRRGVLYFNPGSAGPRRFRLPITVGRLVAGDGKLRAEIIELAVG